jgi:hypothetical protein
MHFKSIISGINKASYFEEKRSGNIECVATLQKAQQVSVLRNKRRELGMQERR